jgi:putative redox protein
MRSARVTPGAGKLQQRVAIGPHTVVADEPRDAGDDTGPAPHDFLLAALGSCTAMTLRLYAGQKGWPLERVEVALEQAKVDAAHEIRRTVVIEGPLSAEQRARLLEIAERCPVHRTLLGEIRIVSKLG